MKIKMKKSTNCDGRGVAAGQVVDASDKDGRFLINSGFAEEYVEKPAPKRKTSKRVDRTVDAAELETRDAG